jgi:hypothetical protein
MRFGQGTEHDARALRRRGFSGEGLDQVDTVHCEAAESRRDFRD